ncbi:MAG: hypothetical protein HPY68_10590 [Candidatus Atribacteria bacterium]|nr:hypothetical protein [Candidatus Atribacteria bacterium]
MKDLIAQNESYLATYLVRENENELSTMEDVFATIHGHFSSYLEALRLGTESEEFKGSQYFSSWQEEAFPYEIKPVAEGSSLAEYLQNLTVSYLDYRLKMQNIQKLHREYLVTTRERNEKAVMMDEPVQVIFNFTKMVDDAIKKLTKPANDTFFFML